MKVDVSAKVLNENKEPLKAGDEDLTIAKAILISLYAPTQSGLSVEKAISSAKVKRKIHAMKEDEKEIELMADEIVLIKEACARALSGAVAGEIALTIDPEKS